MFVLLLHAVKHIKSFFCFIVSTYPIFCSFILQSQAAAASVWEQKLGFEPKTSSAADASVGQALLLHCSENELQLWA